MNSDLIYDVLRRHQPDHILLRATRADAAGGLTDLGRIAGMLERVKGRISHMALSRVSPLAVPVLLDIGRESVRSGEDEDALLAEAEAALVAEATGDAEPPGPSAAAQRVPAVHRRNTARCPPARRAAPAVPPPQRMNPAPLHFAGERLMLDPAGALVWPAAGLLVVSDLHLEKGSSYARRGMLLPPWDTRATLDRLALLLRRWQPHIVVALGDSFHDGEGVGRLPPGEAARLAAMTEFSRFVWVMGNHDPAPQAGLGGHFVEEYACRPPAVPPPGPARRGGRNQRPLPSQGGGAGARLCGEPALLRGRPATDHAAGVRRLYRRPRRARPRHRAPVPARRTGFSPGPRAAFQLRGRSRLSAGGSGAEKEPHLFPMKTVLLWFRNDLRLSDHAALHAAVQAGPVLPVYVLDEEAAGRWAPGGASRWWLRHSLERLAADLAAFGASLVLRRGRAATEIPRLASEAGAAEVFAGRAVEPWARTQERQVADALAASGGRLQLHRTVSLFDHDALRAGSGGPYRVYSPFARACLARGAPAPVPGSGLRPRGTLPRSGFPTSPVSPRSGFPTPPVLPRSGLLDEWQLLPTRPDWAGGLRETWTPGERGAQARLSAFLDHALATYAKGRDLTDRDGTSMLSPHLHFGEISPGQVWHAASHAAEGHGPGLETFLRELLWREFSIHLLWHSPDLPERPLRAEFARMPWRRDAASLRAWQRGRTGVPMVDAAMRQLWQIGWMHNRARMIAASFLVKHLLLPWQAGEEWFWDTLVDADLASNSASWQWVAGSGADASPYFRVFNPVLQGRKFDPDGAYVRRWVPELAGLATSHIHAPWEAPELALRAAGVHLGKTYPRPIVDLAAGRARALAAFRGLAEPAA